MKTEKEKQDCEINAFKRMAPRIKKNYPKLKFIITGDALYATTSMINICKDQKWNYIFNLKKDRLKRVYEDFQDNVNYKNETMTTLIIKMKLIKKIINYLEELDLKKILLTL